MILVASCRPERESGSKDRERKSSGKRRVKPQITAFGRTGHATQHVRPVLSDTRYSVYREKRRASERRTQREKEKERERRFHHHKHLEFKEHYISLFFPQTDTPALIPHPSYPVFESLEGRGVGRASQSVSSTYKFSLFFFSFTLFHHRL